jgi:formate-dependent nitrite reductase membrane component NrfD
MIIPNLLLFVLSIMMVLVAVLVAWNVTTHVAAIINKKGSFGRIFLCIGESFAVAGVLCFLFNIAIPIEFGKLLTYESFNTYMQIAWNLWFFGVGFILSGLMTSIFLKRKWFDIRAIETAPEKAATTGN